MKKSTLLALAVITIFVFSCKNETDQTLISLQKEIKNKESYIIQLEEQNNTIQQQNNKLLENIVQKRVPIDLYRLLPIIDKSAIIQFLIDSTEFNVQDQICYGPFYPAQSWEIPVVTSKLSSFKYLWKKIDRSPGSIKNLLSESEKEAIVRLFAYTDIYFTGEFSQMAEALIAAYEQIKNNPEAIKKIQSEIYHKSDNMAIHHLFTIDGKFHYLVSSKVKELLKNTSCNNRYDYVYSFWARRFHEGNANEVYELLSEMHSRITAISYEEYY